ncbi:MAG TPA: MOSC domain-containing protein [Pyrinomonadaceae bacterium]|jgi:MOSC domain-containing protein YiiM|nr:MOSC domain-containing protein [Pyrinomonadaceae bacterium]
MKLISVNVGRPRLVVWRGGPVSTGIFKEPVGGRVALRTLNLDGDRQADLTVHGGPAKAVYAYPSEHYAYWRGELPGAELPWGMFGENFTTEGLSETSVHVGDRFRVGAAELQVTQPRMPCYKLGIKFGSAEMLKRFLLSGRTGFYFSVTREGEVGVGDEVELVERDPRGVTIADVLRLYVRDRDDVETMRRAVQVEALPDGWREEFLERIERAEKIE